MSKGFEFTVNASHMLTQIQKVLSVTSFSSASDSEKHHAIIVNKKVYIVGLTPETFVSVELTVSDKSKTSGYFEFDISTLSGLIKKREDLVFNYANNLLKINSVKGKYSCELKTIELFEDYVKRIESSMSKHSGKENSLPASVLKSLKDGVAHTSITDVYSDNTLLCYITIANNMIDVSSIDNFHMAKYRAKVKTDAKLRLAVSSSMFTLISKFVSDTEEDAKFFISTKGMNIVGSDFVVSLPPTQVEDANYNIMSSLMKTLPKASCSFVLPETAFNTIDNMMAIVKNDEKLKFSLNTKGFIKIAIETDSGIVSDAFRVENATNKSNISWSVDPRLFFDLYKKVRNLKQSVPMELYSASKTDTSSCFITNMTVEKSKITLIGTYE